MRILHVTDLHFEKNWYRWLAGEIPKHDVTCVTGDFLNLFLSQSPGGSMRSQGDFVSEFLKGIRSPFFCCSGNHDLPLSGVRNLEDDFLLRAREANSNVRIDGTFELYGGMRFICLPWGVRFSRFSEFLEPVMLLTHAPPAGSQIAIGETGDVGDLKARELALRLPSGSVVLSGHAHTPSAWCERLGDTMCFNPGVREGGAFPNHVIIDTKRRFADLRSVDDYEFPMHVRL